MTGSIALRRVWTKMIEGYRCTPLARRDVWGSDSPYVKTAPRQGRARQKIIFGHALRNSLLPVITVAATWRRPGQRRRRGRNVFGWPGIGKLMIDAIIQRDFAVVLAVLVTACAIFILNIAIDILYAVLDPRIRYQTS